MVVPITEEGAGWQSRDMRSIEVVRADHGSKAATGKSHPSRSCEQYLGDGKASTNVGWSVYKQSSLLSYLENVCGAEATPGQHQPSAVACQQWQLTARQDQQQQQQQAGGSSGPTV